MRVLGRPRWNPGLNAGKGVAPAVLEVGETIAIKVQLLDGRCSRWLVERRALEQRYLDAPLPS